MKARTSHILDVIKESKSFLSWLHKREGVGISEMPEEYKSKCKSLEALGIVYKRNNRNLGIKWQRLRRVLQKHGIIVPLDKKELIHYFCNPSLSSSN